MTAALLDRVAADVFDDPIVPARAREFLVDPHHHLVVGLADDVVFTSRLDGRADA